ncbi:MAG: glycosyltransferase family 4 protein [Elsteraceae bacterium]
MEVWQLLDSSGLGGIESHVLTLASGLRWRAVDSRVLFLTDHGPHPLRASLSAEKVPWAVAGGASGLLRALRQSPPDLLHTHGYKAGLLGRAMARLTGVPVVSSFHAGEPGEGRMRLYTALDRLTARLAPRVAVSEKIAAALPGPVTLIPNFVRCPAELPNRPQRRPVIGFVGRMSPEKGPDLFFDLAERLKERCDFVLFGDGPMRAALAAHPAAGRVALRGFVPSMALHWGEMDLLCLSSRHEGLPMAALEAMAYGCPVAGFRVGAMGSVVEHGRTGYLADPLDLDGLESAIRAWLEKTPDERRTMALGAIETVRANYGLDIGLDRMIRLYRTVSPSSSSSTQHQSSGV